MDQLHESSGKPREAAKARAACASGAKPKVALVHDWLTGMRGGERVLEALCDLFPGSDLFTLIHHRGSVSGSITDRRIVTSFLDRIPFLRMRYRAMLPLFPRAIESFDFSGYDFVISSSHCVAKGAIARSGARSISYVHTPMRYVWDMYGQYFPPERLNAVTGIVIPALAARLRAWDAATAGRPDRIIANSRYISERIRRCWGRESEVVHPPVDLSMFAPSPRRENYFLVVSAFAPYKRIDVAVRAFDSLGLRLLVVGDGQDARRLRAMAGQSVEFLGSRTGMELADLYARCRAFVFPGEEDFGITPLEAQASGRPVIAFGKGGALETVAPDPSHHVPRGAELAGKPATGVFFPDQTPESLAEAVKHFIRIERSFDAPGPMVGNASEFGRGVFVSNIRRILAEEGAIEP